MQSWLGGDERAATKPSGMKGDGCRVITSREICPIASRRAVSATARELSLTCERLGHLLLYSAAMDGAAHFDDHPEDADL